MLADDGEWLITNRGILDRGEARWLTRLAGFDHDHGWELDGQNSCVDWLMHRTGMARSTAFEKLQVARSLQDRPLVAEAFEEGRISYSAARAMARMPDPDREVDEAVLRVAEECPISDVERVVRSYQAYRDQDVPPELRVQPSIRIRPYAEGFNKIEAILPALDAEEVIAALQLFATRAYYAQQRGQSAPADCTEDDDDDDEFEDDEDDEFEDDLEELEGGEGESATADSAPPPEPAPSRWAATLVDLTRAAVAHQGKSARNADRYLVHVIVDQDGVTSLPDGTRIPADDAARITCDSSIVIHEYKDGQPLRLGRRSRTWNTNQRRAVLVHDGAGCRFPGCHHRIVDLHHHQPWEQDGPTDVENAYNLCRHHHGLIHQGRIQTHGEPTGQVRFYRPDHTLIGHSTPLDRRALSLSTAG